MPNTSQVLKKNRVASIIVKEKMESSFVITHHFIINENGIAVASEYFDPFYQGSGTRIEKNWISQDTIGMKRFTQGIYDEEGKLIRLYSDHSSFYSSTGKILRTIHHDYTDFHILQINVFDTLHPDDLDRTEWKMFNNDTLSIVVDRKNEFISEHILKDKIQGKWIETEKSISNFNNGELISYYLYKNGKLVQEYLKENDFDKVGTDDVEEEFGLPIPAEAIDTFFVDVIKIDSMKTVSEKKAKFRMIMHYEEGKSNGLSYYEVFDNKTDLFLFVTDAEGTFRNEYHYVFRK
jgi:hypothetical protein